MNIVLMRSCSLPKDEYHELLDPIAHVTCIPALCFTFINTGHLFKQIMQPNLYSGVIMTSKRAVKALELCLGDSKRVPLGWNNVPCYVVGDSTAFAAKHLGFQPTGMESGCADALARLIISDKDHRESNAPLLFLCGQNRRETLTTYLQEHEQPMDIIEVYSTTADPHVEENINTYCQENALPKYLVYYSPLGCKFSYFMWKEHIQGIEPFAKVVTIGGTTAKYFQDEDVEVVVATEPTASAVFRAIDGDMKSQI